MSSNPQPDRSSSGPLSSTASRIALGVFLAIALFFLWSEHRAHLYGALPYVLLRACPLMHFFHHRGHGQGHHHGGAGSQARQRPEGDRS